MSIIEKLGITPGPWHHCTANGGHCACGCVWGEDGETHIATVESDHKGAETRIPKADSSEYKANLDLITAAPEMLEALIENQNVDETVFGSGDTDYQKLIEKVTGKSWAEIKELI